MRVITVGSASQCDLVIDMPTLRDEIRQGILPIHCQIVQFDNGNFMLKAFGSKIWVNNCFVDFLSDDKKMGKREILLDFEDRIDIGIELYWQQWFYGFGLNCENCKYSKYCSSEDVFCDYCKSCCYNPGPYKGCYSRNFNLTDFFNYVSCNTCSYKGDWCRECTFLIEPEPKNRSWREQIEMYNARLPRC